MNARSRRQPPQWIRPLGRPQFLWICQRESDSRLCANSACNVGCDRTRWWAVAAGMLIRQRKRGGKTLSVNGSGHFGPLLTYAGGRSLSWTTGTRCYSGTVQCRWYLRSGLMITEVFMKNVADNGCLWYTRWVTINNLLRLPFSCYERSRFTACVRQAALLDNQPQYSHPSKQKPRTANPGVTHWEGHLTLYATSLKDWISRHLFTSFAVKFSC